MDPLKQRQPPKLLRSCESLCVRAHQPCSSSRSRGLSTSKPGELSSRAASQTKYSQWPKLPCWVFRQVNTDHLLAAHTKSQEGSLLRTSAHHRQQKMELLCPPNVAHQRCMKGHLGLCLGSHCMDSTVQMREKLPRHNVRSGCSCDQLWTPGRVDQSKWMLHLRQHPQRFGPRGCSRQPTYLDGKYMHLMELAPARSHFHKEEPMYHKFQVSATDPLIPDFLWLSVQTGSWSWNLFHLHCCSWEGWRSIQPERCPLHTSWFLSESLTASTTRSKLSQPPHASPCTPRSEGSLPKQRNQQIVVGQRRLLAGKLKLSTNTFDD